MKLGRTMMEPNFVFPGVVALKINTAKPKKVEL